MSSKQVRKVLKFGGTSVGTVERLKAVAELIRNEKNSIIVLSAMAGTTNKLVEIAEHLFINNNDDATRLIALLREQYEKILPELFLKNEIRADAAGMIKSHFDYIGSFTQDSFTPYEEKAILAQGELISTALFHLYLLELDINSILLPALKFMRIDKSGEPDDFYIKESLEREINDAGVANIYITQGFICRNAFGEIDNLKRGGSDYTASLVGAAAQVDEIQIWTDISGIHNNDPREVEQTFPIEQISFDEAAELAYFGAKILHPSSIKPAREKGIPVILKNTMKPNDSGTIISETGNNHKITAVAAKDGITALKINSGRMLMAYGFLRKVFEIFERYRTPIDMITTSEVAVSLTIDDTTYLDRITQDLKEFGSVEIDRNQSIVCIVGFNLAKKQGAAVEVLTALKDIPIRMISCGGSLHNISVLVDQKNKNKALNLLNDKLFKQSYV